MIISRLLYVCTRTWPYSKCVICPVEIIRGYIMLYVSNSAKSTEYYKAINESLVYIFIIKIL